VDGADDALVGGVDDFKCLAVHTFHELVVDEAGDWSVGEWRKSGPRSFTHSPVGCSYSPVCGVLSV
jgi:hypothetical protein